MIQHQVHDKFKIFAGERGKDGGLGSLGEQVAQFVREKKVAAKSIGVEYLESSRRLVVSLGYHEGGDSYPVRLATISLGRRDDLLAGGDYSVLEGAIAAAAARVANIICHELFVTEENELVLVFMTHVPT